ncbi:DUF881 domain-containing protein [Clostridium aminobutyricum]|uniref:DUF881 domain-containing protein n=1 Tax=Clostridium aminobutyricum TaxID=33953 RepID=A0A939DAH9_CLOAM|nr:DUF881 domain-containing protein [Clostridium aminobutyricum]MBN7774241.1 DUF881 domain-containing protein [Clostridium aminobutyricum]
MSKKRIVVAFVICFVLGLGIACQAKVSDGERLYVSSKTIEDYKTTITSEKEEIEKIKGLIAETQEKIEIYDAMATEQGADITFQTNLETDVQKYKIASGNQAVQGPGVEVTIDDGTRDLFYGEDVNNLLVHDMDIVMIINELHKSGAEAISVNGQRITPNTSITCSGYTVRINGEVYARPFRIKAIGDGKRMAAALVDPIGYGTSLKNWGVQFQVKLSDDIRIDAVSRAYTFKYMTKL